MPLVTQADYARRRGISREAVRQRTVTAGGPIPVHGPRKLLDVAQADALCDATKSTAGASHATGNGAAPAPLGIQLAQARAAALVVDVQAKRLALEQRRGALISRDRATLKAFAFARMLRDRWLAWPSRVGPLLAATFDLDAGAVTVVLEGYVARAPDRVGERAVRVLGAVDWTTDAARVSGRSRRPLPSESTAQRLTATACHLASNSSARGRRVLFQRFRCRSRGRVGQPVEKRSASHTGS
jgi:hypothetical protein